MTVEHNSVLINADNWMRGTGLPYYTVAMLREMKVGDILTLVNFKGPGIAAGHTGCVSVDVERRRGYWAFDAIWLLYIGRNAFRRGTIWAPDVRFKVRPGRQFEFTGNKGGSDYIRLFLRQCRFLARSANAAGDRKAYVAMLPYPSQPSEHENRSMDAAEWLGRMCALPPANTEEVL